MQAVEALQVTLKLATERHDQEIWPEDDRGQEAIELCKSFQNTAVPLARFRCYVTIEGLNPKSKLGLGDFTICGLTIPSIKNGLIGLRMEKVQARCLLWELKQDGTADMISGYQGDTKTLGFRNWLADIDRHEPERPEVQAPTAIQVPSNG